MYKNLHKTLRFLVSITFLVSSFSVSKVQAGEIIVPLMPKPGTIVNLSPFYSPAYLNGVVIHPDNALQFDFLIHKGDGNLDLSQKNEEYTKLVKYFLASLTIPDEDQWVNLSPYEHDRIIKDSFGKTEMGRDLLSQDYLLKQITSSLMYPESGLGKNFWDKVYERAYQEFGNANVPVNTFNKVWIVPDEALVYESGNTAYVVKSHLKVMLEEDYLSLEKHAAVTEIPNKTHAMSSKIVKEIILPQIEKEVNEGKNFAQLRQIFSGMVLATWYKRALRESLLGKVYADKAKVAGVNQDPTNNEKIYQQYLVAFKKGVYNYIKEDVDKYTNQIIPRKYFSGGFVNQAMKVLEVRKGVSERDMAQAVSAGGLIDDEDRATVALAGKGEKLAIDRAMNTAATIMKDLRPEQKRTLGIPYRHAEFQDLQQNFLAGSFVRNVPLELTRFPGLETQSTVPDKKIVFDTVEKTSPTTSVKKAIYFNEVVAAGNKTYAIGYENVAEGMPYLRIFVREEGQIAWKLLVRTEGVEYNDQVVIVPHELQTALNQLQEQSAANPLGIFRVEDQKVAAFQADVLAKSDLLGKEFFTPQSSRVRYNENSKEHQPDLTTVINVDHIASVSDPRRSFTSRTFLSNDRQFLYTYTTDDISQFAWISSLVDLQGHSILGLQGYPLVNNIVWIKGVPTKEEWGFPLKDVPMIRDFHERYAAHRKMVSLKNGGNEIFQSNFEGSVFVVGGGATGLRLSHGPQGLSVASNSKAIIMKPGERVVFGEQTETALTVSFGNNNSIEIKDGVPAKRDGVGINEIIAASQEDLARTGKMVLNQDQFKERFRAGLASLVQKNIINVHLIDRNSEQQLRLTGLGLNDESLRQRMVTFLGERAWQLLNETVTHPSPKGSTVIFPYQRPDAALVAKSPVIPTERRMPSSTIFEVKQRTSYEPGIVPVSDIKVNEVRITVSVNPDGIMTVNQEGLETQRVSMGRPYKIAGITAQIVKMGPIEYQVQPSADAPANLVLNIVQHDPAMATVIYNETVSLEKAQTKDRDGEGAVRDISERVSPDGSVSLPVMRKRTWGSANSDAFRSFEQQRVLLSMPGKMLQVVDPNGNIHKGRFVGYSASEASAAKKGLTLGGFGAYLAEIDGKIVPVLLRGFKQEGAKFSFMLLNRDVLTVGDQRVTNDTASSEGREVTIIDNVMKVNGNNITIPPEGFKINDQQAWNSQGPVIADVAIILKPANGPEIRLSISKIEEVESANAAMAARRDGRAPNSAASGWDIVVRRLLELSEEVAQAQGPAASATKPLTVDFVAYRRLFNAPTDQTLRLEGPAFESTIAQYIAMAREQLKTNNETLAAHIIAPILAVMHNDWQVNFLAQSNLKFNRIPGASNPFNIDGIQNMSPLTDKEKAVVKDLLLRTMNMSPGSKITGPKVRGSRELASALGIDLKIPRIDESQAMTAVMRSALLAIGISLMGASQVVKAQEVDADGMYIIAKPTAAQKAKLRDIYTLRKFNGQEYLVMNGEVIKFKEKPVVPLAPAASAPVASATVSNVASAVAGVSNAALAEITDTHDQSLLAEINAKIPEATVILNSAKSAINYMPIIVRDRNPKEAETSIIQTRDYIVSSKEKLRADVYTSLVFSFNEVVAKIIISRKPALKEGSDPTARNVVNNPDILINGSPTYQEYMRLKIDSAMSYMDVNGPRANFAAKAFDLTASELSIIDILMQGDRPRVASVSRNLEASNAPVKVDPFKAAGSVAVNTQIKDVPAFVGSPDALAKARAVEAAQFPSMAKGGIYTFKDRDGEISGVFDHIDATGVVYLKVLVSKTSIGDTLAERLIRAGVLMPVRTNSVVMKAYFTLESLNEDLRTQVEALGKLPLLQNMNELKLVADIRQIADASGVIWTSPAATKAMATPLGSIKETLNTGSTYVFQTRDGRKHTAVYKNAVLGGDKIIVEVSTPEGKGMLTIRDVLSVFDGNNKLVWSRDAALVALERRGGIDLNGANLNFQIKRDGRGVPLPLPQQDMHLLQQIEGFVPTIIEIKPVTTLPMFSALGNSETQKFASAS